MEIRKSSLEKGQSLVIVAVLIVVFFGMLALALDVGMVYMNRRAAQNAADAGALAGARQLCETEDPDLAVAAAEAAAIDYAENRNGPSIRAIPRPMIDAGTKQVTVYTQIVYNTFFMSFFGRSSMVVPAVASAGCYPPENTLGALPVAWSCDFPLGQTGNAEECGMRYQDESQREVSPINDCRPGEDDIYVISDSMAIEEEILCLPPGPSPATPTPEPTPTSSAVAVDCDYNDDGVDDIFPLSHANRTWLLLDAGAGVPDLRDWILGGFGGDTAIHTWYKGHTGEINTLYQAVDTREGDTFIVPIFDLFCDQAPYDGICQWHSGVDRTEPPVSPPPGDYYHVISFAYFHVTCVDDGGSPRNTCPAAGTFGLETKYAGVSGPNSFKTIEGCFVRGYVPTGRGSGNPDSGLYTIYLNR